MPCNLCARAEFVFYDAAIQEVGKVAIVGRFSDFLNASRERNLLLGGIRLKRKLVTWCFLHLMLLCRLLTARWPRGWFSFDEKCPQIVQLLGKVTNSGRFPEKLNGASRLAAANLG